MEYPRLYLGADHNGYRLKEQLKRWLQARGFAVHDLGAARYKPRDDYPIYAAAVARAVSAARGEGVLICGSGHGMAMAANRFRRVRAALCLSPASARQARHDDHANVIVLASWATTFPAAKKILTAWKKTAWSRVPRHRRRVAMFEHLR